MLNYLLITGCFLVFLSFIAVINLNYFLYFFNIVFRNPLVQNEKLSDWRKEFRSRQFVKQVIELVFRCIQIDHKLKLSNDSSEENFQH